METLSDPRHKISRQFKVLNDFKEHGWSFPVSAEIDPTWNCSLNCKGCHSKWLHKDQELSEADVERILRELTIHGCKSVTWSGGGEPLEWAHWQFGMKEASRWKLDQGLYTYMPEPSQEKVNFLEDHLAWIYSHNFRTKGLRRTNQGTVWTAGWLLDKDTWHRIGEYVEKTDLDFFDFVDFRPLIMDGADYSWVPKAIAYFEKFHLHPKIKWAKYKFLDLLRTDKGRTYTTCYSTDFTASIGPNGDCYECLNRRGVTVIGNLLKEDLETIWKRKNHCRSDFTGCRMLCRNHELNKSLEYLVGPEPLHANFV